MHIKIKKFPAAGNFKTRAENLSSREYFYLLSGKILPEVYSTMERKAKTTSYSVTGLGIAVSALGWSMLPSKIGAGVLGFGAAHVLLGLLDSRRPTVREADSGAVY